MFTRTLVGDAVDVEEIRARSGDQRVHQQHVGAELDEAARDVAADEAEAAGDHHAAAAIELLIRRGHSTRCPALPRGVSSPAAASRLSMRAAHHERVPQLQHVDARAKDAAEIEELRLAVSAVVVVNRRLDDGEAGVLDFLHHLQADDAAVLLEPHAIEDRAPHQAEIAVDVAHLQPEHASSRCDDRSAR